MLKWAEWKFAQRALAVLSTRGFASRQPSADQNLAWARRRRKGVRKVNFYLHKHAKNVPKVEHFVCRKNSAGLTDANQTWNQNCHHSKVTGILGKQVHFECARTHCVCRLVVVVVVKNPFTFLKVLRPEQFINFYLHVYKRLLAPQRTVNWHSCCTKFNEVYWRIRIKLINFPYELRIGPSCNCQLWNNAFF